MPSDTWDLALAELIYYIPTAFPVLYCFWKHWHAGITGWLFLTAFVLLQLIGAGLTLSAGQYGVPSTTAVTITSVGLSPLILAIAGIVKEWTKLAGLLRTKKQNTVAITIEVIFHLAVMVSIAIYATGASNASKPGADSGDVDEWKAGIILLLLMWMILCASFAFLTPKVGVKFSMALFWSISISLGFVGLRVIYQVIATFNQNQGEYSPINGSIALRVIFQFLPGAFTILALIVGGITSLELVAMAEVKATADIPMASRVVEEGGIAREGSK